MNRCEFEIEGRSIGEAYPPLVIAEIGINHEGSVDRAIEMIDAVADAGGECVKFQTHIVEDEMIPNDVVPGNAGEPIWDIVSRCALSADDEIALQSHARLRGLIYLSTPFSRLAVDRLAKLDVPAIKIGSGECNNYPLVEHVASKGKPVILSTGMNDLSSISTSVAILRDYSIPFALLHCTSIYPTPYRLVRLGALEQLKVAFPDAVVGLSDHSPSIYPLLGSVALGARILERHFTSDARLPGPDIEVSMTPDEFQMLSEGSDAIFKALGGCKDILAEEEPTIRFAYASVVTTRAVPAGTVLDATNIWVKRPGTGEIPARFLRNVSGRLAAHDLPADVQLKWADLS